MTEGREAHLKSGKIQSRYIAQGYFPRVKPHSKVSTKQIKLPEKKMHVRKRDIRATMVTVMESQHPIAGNQMLKQLMSNYFRQNPRKCHLKA